MGLINWIFDIYQHSKIEDLRAETAQMRRETMTLRSAGGGLDLSRLEAAIGELALAVKTVQRLAVEKGLCTPAELARKMHEIDLEDGRADGRSPVS